jgi:hypothetical protein
MVEGLFLETLDADRDHRDHATQGNAGQKRERSGNGAGAPRCLLDAVGIIRHGGTPYRE